MPPLLDMFFSIGVTANWYSKILPINGNSTTCSLSNRRSADNLNSFESSKIIKGSAALKVCSGKMALKLTSAALPSLNITISCWPSSNKVRISPVERFMIQPVYASLTTAVPAAPPTFSRL